MSDQPRIERIESPTTILYQWMVWLPGKDYPTLVATREAAEEIVTQWKNTPKER